MKRISKIASEINVSVVKIIQALKEEYSSDYNPTSKITRYKELFIKNKFKEDFQKKTLANKRSRTFYFRVDEAFMFSSEEINYPSESIKEHLSIQDDILSLRQKAGRFSSLHDDEITSLLRVKYEKLERLQSSIKLERKENEENRIISERLDKEQSDRDWYNNDCYDPEAEIMNALRNGEGDKFGF